MAPLGPRLTDGHPENVSPLQSGMAQEQLPRGVESLNDGLVLLVASLKTEADQIQRMRCNELEIRVGIDPGGEFLRKGDVLSDMVPQSLDPVMRRTNQSFRARNRRPRGICQSR